MDFLNYFSWFYHVKCFWSYNWSTFESLWKIIILIDFSNLIFNPFFYNFWCFNRLNVNFTLFSINLRDIFTKSWIFYQIFNESTHPYINQPTFNSIILIIFEPFLHQIFSSIFPSYFSPSFFYQILDSIRIDLLIKFFRS